MAQFVGTEQNETITPSTVSTSVTRTPPGSFPWTAGDLISAGQDGDLINGGKSDDVITGDAGDDTRLGDRGQDTIIGGDGNDTLNGQSEDDSLNGRGQDDSILGGNAGDIIFGEEGSDMLIGGTGADTFRYSPTTDSAAGSADAIAGFDGAGVTGGDVIRLIGIDANATITGNQAFNFIGIAWFTHTAGDLRVSNSGANTLLRGNVNGDGNPDFQVVIQDGATVAADHTAADFLLEARSTTVRGDVS